MQSLMPLRLRPLLQRILCIKEAHKASGSKTNKYLLSEVPLKPKRPPNAYLMFVKDVESKIFTGKPHATRMEMMRTAGEMWRAADEKVKARYNEMYYQKSKEFEKILENFNKSLTTEQKNSLKQYEELQSNKKKLKESRRILKELGKPKRPPSGFGIFLAEHEGKTSLAGESNRERLGRLNREWTNMPEQEKTIFMNKARQLLDGYYHDLRQWELSMLRKFEVPEDEIDLLMEEYKKAGSRKLMEYLHQLAQKEGKVN